MDSTSNDGEGRQNAFNSSAWLVGDPVIGEGTWIGAFCVIDGSGGLTIGRYCDISSGSQIYTHSTVQRAISEGAEKIRRKTSSIGDYCHVGAGAIILMGAQIGSHCVIGAGSVVLEGTTAPDFSVLVGNPARVQPGRAHRFTDTVPFES